MNERRCIITRKSCPVSELIRFVAGPQGTVEPDLKARLPGRGAWVSAQYEVVERAARKGAFAHALKSGAVAADDLADQVLHLLEQRALGAIGLAARSGAVVTGFSKVDRALRQADLEIVFCARDAAADSRRKIDQALAASPSAKPHQCHAFSGQQLSLALGRPNVIHAGVAAGRTAASINTALLRYESFVEGTIAANRAA